MEGYTDASVVDGYSLHSYVLIKEGKILLEKCMRSNTKDSVKAEIISVIALLNECKKRKIKDVRINTDCLSVTILNKEHKLFGGLIGWMRKLLVDINGEIQWISRNQNEIADKLCRNARKKMQKLEELRLNKFPPELKSERKLKFKTTIEKIIVNKISEEERAYFNQYYSSFIYKNKRKSLDVVIKWCERESFNNTKRGKQYLIESFVANNHSIDDINTLKAGHAFIV